MLRQRIPTIPEFFSVFCKNDPPVPDCLFLFYEILTPALDT